MHNFFVLLLQTRAGLLRLLLLASSADNSTTLGRDVHLPAEPDRVIDLALETVCLARKTRNIAQRMLETCSESNGQVFS